MNTPSQMTVGQLRAALEGVADDLPVVVNISNASGDGLGSAYPDGAFPDEDEPVFNINAEIQR